MKPASLVPLALVVVLAAGCDDIVVSEREWVEFTALADPYVAGGTGTIHLANHTDGLIHANLCHMVVERWVEGVGWVDIVWREQMPCPAAEPLQAGREVEFDFPLRDDLPTGAYRARVQAGYGGEPLELVTETFEVQGTGEV